MDVKKTRQMDTATLGGIIGSSIVVIGAIIAVTIVIMNKRKTNNGGNSANEGNYILTP